MKALWLSLALLLPMGYLARMHGPLADAELSQREADFRPLTPSSFLQESQPIVPTAATNATTTPAPEKSDLSALLSCSTEGTWLCDWPFATVTFPLPGSTDALKTYRFTWPKRKRAPRRVLASVRASRGWAANATFAVTVHTLDNSQMPAAFTFSVFKAVESSEVTELRRMTGNLPAGGEREDPGPGWPEPVGNETAYIDIVEFPEDDLFVEFGSDIFHTSIDRLAYVVRPFRRPFSPSLVAPLVFVTPELFHPPSHSATSRTFASGVAVNIHSSTHHGYKAKYGRVDAGTGRKMGWQAKGWDKDVTVVLHWVAIQPPQAPYGPIAKVIFDQEVFGSVRLPSGLTLGRVRLTVGESTKLTYNKAYKKTPPKVFGIIRSKRGDDCASVLYSFQISDVTTKHFRVLARTVEGTKGRECEDVFFDFLVFPSDPEASPPPAAFPSTETQSSGGESSGNPAEESTGDEPEREQQQQQPAPEER
ncbi:unnamed protein product [Vitrella brassicaformis CCMP3155]|uniref:Uncharacterized protein n=2 Tax=Vitrella brassicaformis TaxID=1169539 RepID=A0A0G4EZP0_VITBC|nr:unnamed protein product [Vitrella brassicaformis CCMP3155]|eukprot:CEM04288.1 unnamed protein product [Vitrella brassicaformis CCMP3155]